MGRNYITSQGGPSFIEGIYTPPWELINSALETNQKGYDTALGSTSLFDNLNIQHINDPVIQERVKKIQDEYSQKTQEIVNTLQKDPTSWRKANMSIQSLAKDLQKNITSGDIARYQKQYNDLSTFMKENEDYKKKHPEDYNRALSYFMQKFQEDPERKSDFAFESLATPIDQKELIDQVQQIKASARELPNGMYLVGEKEVPYDQIDATARGIVYGQYSGYLNQQKKFGNTDFYNAEYEKLHPETGGIYEKLYYDTKGRLLGSDSDKEVQDRLTRYYKDVDAYNALTPKQREKAVVPTLDMSVQTGAIGRILGTARAAGHYKETSLKSDPVALAKFNAAKQQAISSANLAFQKEKFNADQIQRAYSNNLSLLNIVAEQKKALVDADTGKPTDEKLYKELSETEKQITNSIIGLSIKSNSNDKQAYEKSGKGEAFIPYSTTVTTQIGDPKKIDDVFAATIAKGNTAIPGTMLNKLSQQYLGKLSNSISKVENKNQKEYLQGFMDYYKKNVKPYSTLEDMANDYALSHPYKGKEGNRQTSFKPFKDANPILAATLLTESMFKAQNQKVGKDFLVQSLKNLGYDKYKEEITKISQQQQVMVQPVSEDFEKEIKKVMFAPGNQNSFTFREFEDGKYGSELPVENKVLEALKNGKAKIEGLFSDPIANSVENAYIVSYEGKNFIVEPPQGYGQVSTSVENLIKQPWATGESALYEQKNQPEADYLTHQLSEAMRITPKADVMQASINYKIGGKDVTFKQVNRSTGEGGSSTGGYMAFLNGQPIYDFEVPTLYDKDGQMGLLSGVKTYIEQKYGRK